MGEINRKTDFLSSGRNSGQEWLKCGQVRMSEWPEFGSQDVSMSMFNYLQENAINWRFLQAFKRLKNIVRICGSNLLQISSIPRCYFGNKTGWEAFSSKKEKIFIHCNTDSIPIKSSCFHFGWSFCWNNKERAKLGPQGFHTRFWLQSWLRIRWRLMRQ